MRFGDVVERYSPDDARLDSAVCQQAEEPLQVFSEPGGMSRAHHVNRVEAGTLVARQPSPKIKTCYPHQDSEHPTLRLRARRVTNGAEQAAALERGKRAAIAVLADAVEDHIESIR